MSEAWAAIVSVIIFMIIFGYVSSKLSERKRKKLRAKTMPLISDYPQLGVRYNIHLSDGRKFIGAELLGSVENNDAHFTFAGYDGMLVIRQESGKKAYVKMTSVRCIEEA